MPTYDYECAACGHRYELFETVHASGVKTCPKCRKRRAKRQIGTGAGFLFKGSGFYTTDYKRGGGGNGGTLKPAEKKEEKQAETTEAPKPEKKKVAAD